MKCGLSCDSLKDLLREWGRWFRIKVLSAQAKGLAFISLKPDKCLVNMVAFLLFLSRKAERQVISEKAGLERPASLVSSEID